MWKVLDKGNFNEKDLYAHYSPSSSAVSICSCYFGNQLEHSSIDHYDTTG